jgi:2-polyprenyl-3-methyl-5-hydroxy-6-metoxy-1,4-benzoquinol methylase
MHYDPIKEQLGKIFNRNPLLRKLFYLLLDILLLRSWHVHKAVLKGFDPSGEKLNILDAGMGFGQYTWWMSRKFMTATINAADIKAEQVADCNNFFSQCKISYRVKAIEADLTQLSLAGSFDLILCVDVMEHITDDITVFKNFNASLVNDGILIISTPSDKGGSDVHGDADESFIGEHVRDGYSVEDITAKLSKCGFKEVNASYTYGTPGSIAWRLSMKLPVIMLSWSRIMFIFLPFYYIVVMPFCLVLNYLDLSLKHRRGTGLLVTAVKG